MNTIIFYSNEDGTGYNQTFDITTKKVDFYIYSPKFHFLIFRAFPLT